VKNLKITCLPVRIVIVLVFCVSVTLCGVVFYSLKEVHAGQALPGGGSVTSVSVTISPTSTSTSSASVKWISTAQEAKKRAEALKMQAPVRPKEIAQNTDEGAVATAKYAIELYNYTFATGNVDEYKALCISDRKSCAKVPVDALKMHQNGGWVDPIQVTFVSGWVRKDVTKNVVVQLWFYRNASQEHSGQGELQNISASLVE